MIIPQRPKTEPIKGFTSVKPGSEITSVTGTKFNIKEAGGVFVNSDGVSALEHRQRLWEYYADGVESNVESYNSDIEKHNSTIKDDIKEAKKSWWQKVF